MGDQRGLPPIGTDGELDPGMLLGVLEKPALVWGLKPSISLILFIKFLQNVTQSVFSEALLDKDLVCLVSAVP